MIKTESVSCSGIKFIYRQNGKIAGRAFLYIIFNDLHKRPFGLIEDVFIAEDFRSRGIGTKLIKTIIAKARNAGCYKLLATNRYQRSKVHELYKKIGFEDYGKEFRINL